MPLKGFNTICSDRTAYLDKQLTELEIFLEKRSKAGCPLNPEKYIHYTLPSKRVLDDPSISYTNIGDKPPYTVHLFNHMVKNGLIEKVLAINVSSRGVAFAGFLKDNVIYITSLGNIYLTNDEVNSFYAIRTLL